MSTKGQAKHKLCRRVGECIWGSAKCPSIKRAYPAGAHGKMGGRQRKLSTYGTLLIEKQKLKGHYAISEKQLRNTFAKAKAATGRTNENLLQLLECRLDSVVYRSGLAPTIFAAKQIVNHGHILVNGKKLDRSSYQVKEGAVISINPEKSPIIAENAKKSNSAIPAYLETNLDECKTTLVRVPMPEEVPIKVEVMSVVEYYAR